MEARRPEHVRQVTTRREATIQRVRGILRRHGLRSLIGNGVVEGCPAVTWQKGTTVLSVLRACRGADWIARVRAVYLGDDSSDEEAFRSLKGIGRAIRILSPGGPPATEADLEIEDHDHVTPLIRWLTSGAFRVR